MSLIGSSTVLCVSIQLYRVILLHTLHTSIGLKLRLESQSCLLQSYSYALFPGMKQSIPVSWRYLVTEDEGMENIRLHELVEGQKLASLLKEFNYFYIKAVVLVNTEDHYELAAEFVTGVKEVPVPLLVVKRTDGEDILRCLESHTREFVFVMVDAENQVSDKNPPQAVATKPKAEHQSGIGRESLNLLS